MISATVKVSIQSGFRLSLLGQVQSGKGRAARVGPRVSFKGTEAGSTGGVVAEIEEGDACTGLPDHFEPRYATISGCRILR